MIKRKFIVGCVAIGAFFFGLASQPKVSHASNTFSKSELSGPSGYFSSSKRGVAFHWRNIKSDNGVHTYIFFGDFKAPQLQLGYPVKNSLSANKRTFTARYQLEKSKKVRSFKLTKLSNTTYRVKLSKVGKSYLPSSTGKTYTLTKTKKSPATSLANRFTKPLLQKNYEKQLNDNLQKQYDKMKAAGQNVSNPTTDPEVQQKVKETAQTATNKTLKQFIKAFG